MNRAARPLESWRPGEHAIEQKRRASGKHEADTGKEVGDDRDRCSFGLVLGGDSRGSQSERVDCNNPCTAWHSRRASSLTTSIDAIASRPQSQPTMASRLVPFACRIAPRASRPFQRAQWRAFSASRPAWNESGSLNVVCTFCPQPPALTDKTGKGLIASFVAPRHAREQPQDSLQIHGAK